MVFALAASMSHWVLNQTHSVNCRVMRTPLGRMHPSRRLRSRIRRQNSVLWWVTVCSGIVVAAVRGSEGDLRRGPWRAGGLCRLHAVNDTEDDIFLVGKMQLTL